MPLYVSLSLLDKTEHYQREGLHYNDGPVLETWIFKEVSSLQGEQVLFMPEELVHEDAGPVLADGGDDGDDEDSQIRANNAQRLQASLPPGSENPGRRCKFYSWAGRMPQEVA